VGKLVGPHWDSLGIMVVAIALAATPSQISLYVVEHAVIAFSFFQIMADALCGPSNALQSFQKHTTVDRTLQQDRLVGRHSSSQVSEGQRNLDSGFLTSDRVSDHLLQIMWV
jgi:hypothetical protein